eukprot:TRINITY_DN36650_c0_g1_i1.p1 TRINITY_DN36650_c0_g1~~TRINITY_DN36650_c0_g1_i1.p1  ORF type:complete len:537 (+),score=96.19 TRINITY_DN36650_c0_g1_i1:104-1714(+)
MLAVGARRWCSSLATILGKYGNFEEAGSLNRLKKVKEDCSHLRPTEIINYFSSVHKMNDVELSKLVIWMDSYGNVLNTRNKLSELDILADNPQSRYLTYQAMTRACAAKGAIPYTLAYLRKMVTEPSWESKVRWDALFKLLVKKITPGSSSFDAMVDIIELSVTDGSPTQCSSNFIIQLAKQNGCLHSSRSYLLDRFFVPVSERPEIQLISMCSDTYGTAEAIINVIADNKQLQKRLSFDDFRHNVLSSLNASSLIKREANKVLDYLNSFPTNEPNKPSSYCRPFKLGVCDDESCNLIHQLVKCPDGLDCKDALCPFVHPTEIPYKWAADIDLGTISKNDNKPKAKSPRKETKPLQEKNSTPKTSSIEGDLFYTIKGLKLPTEKVLRTKEDVDSVNKFQSLMKELTSVMLKKEDERQLGRSKRQRDGNRAVSKFLKLPERMSLTEPKSEDQRLSDALAGCSQPEIPKLPSLKTLSSARKSHSLLDVLRRPRPPSNAGKRKSSPAPPPPPPPPPPPSLTKKPSWFEELKDVVDQSKK